MSAAPGTGFQRQKGFDLLVVGGGIAGLTAAWHGARAGISVVLAERGPLFGGQVATLGRIDDFPLPAPASGAELAATILNDARSAGAAICEEPVLKISPRDEGFLVDTPQRRLRAHNVAIASGASLTRLDLPAAAKLEGHGISQCASCDGAFFRGSDVVVIGGGDGALQAALLLAETSGSVTVIVRGRLRAKQAYINAASRKANLHFRWDSVVEAILGNSEVGGVRVRDLKSGDSEDLACAGVFPLIGVEPNSEFTAGLLERADDGRIRTGPHYETNVPGIYAIGCVRAGFGGALASAAGEGAAVAAAVAKRCRR